MPRYYNPRYNQNMLVEGIDYTSQIDPQFQQGMLEAMSQRQQRYDQTNQLQAEYFSKLYEVASADEELKNKVIGNLKNQYNSVVNKNNGDLALAQNDIIKLISEGKRDPFWQLNAAKMKNIEEFDKLSSQIRATTGADPFVWKNPYETPIMKSDGTYSSLEELGQKVGVNLDKEKKRSDLWEKALHPEQWSSIKPEDDFTNMAIQTGITDRQVIKKSQWLYDQYRNSDEYQQERLELQRQGNTNPDATIAQRVLDMGYSKTYGQSRNSLIRNPSSSNRRKNVLRGENTDAMILPSPTIPIKSKASPLGDNEFNDKIINNNNLSDPSSYSDVYKKPEELKIKTIKAFDNLSSNEKFKTEILSRMSPEDQALWKDLERKHFNKNEGEYSETFVKVGQEGINKIEKERESKRKELIQKAKNINEALKSGDLLFSTKIITYNSSGKSEDNYSVKRKTDEFYDQLSNISIYDPETNTIIEDPIKKKELLLNDKGDKLGVVSGQYTIDNPFGFLSGDSRFYGPVQQINVNGKQYIATNPLADSNQRDLDYLKQVSKLYQDAKFTSPNIEMNLPQDEHTVKGATYKYNSKEGVFEFKIPGEEPIKSSDFEQAYSDYINREIDIKNSVAETKASSENLGRVINSKNIIEFKEKMGQKESGGNSNVVNLIDARGKYQFMPSTMESLGYSVEEYDNASLPEKEQLDEELMNALILSNIKTIANLGYKIDPTNLNNEAITLLSAAHYGGMRAVKALINKDKDILDQEYSYNQDNYKTKWPSIRQDLAKLGLDIDKLNFNKLKG